jgi:hypothetical protein
MKLNGNTIERLKIRNSEESRENVRMVQRKVGIQHFKCEGTGVKILIVVFRSSYANVKPL